MKLTLIYKCIKCKKELDVNSNRCGRVPELCPECKREKELLDLRTRQRRFYTKKQLRKELNIIGN